MYCSMNMEAHMRKGNIVFQPEGLGGGSDYSLEGWTLKTFRQHITDNGHLKV